MWIVVRRAVSWLLSIAFLASVGVQAQNAPPPLFKPEELDQMLAPVALYPDALLMQVLMAATYPLDVVKATNWAKAHPDKKGDAAVQAVASEAWDVSVKSLVAFPQILSTMSDKIEWTQKIGDAFLGQQKEVLDSVQRLRHQAQTAGHLSSNPQQTVSTQGQTIVIQPASPQVIYVPAYNPTVVYGVWAYPAYPPVYYPPPPAYYPGGAFVSGFAWGLGVAATAAIFSDCDWDNRDVNIDIDRAINIDRNYVNTGNINTGNINRSSWQHNPRQRGGVAYRDTASQQRYAKSVAGAEARQQYRGRDAGMQTTAAQHPPSTTAGERPAGASRRAEVARQPAQQPSAGAFEGLGNGSRVQQEAVRGQSSQQAMVAHRGGDGAAWGGGGRAAGFGARDGGGRQR
jgi:hypothetical protein